MATLTSRDQDVLSPTKLTYIGERPATITLRRCKLVVVQGAEVRQHVFDKDVLTIGAADENDLVIEDDTVSRTHCRITRDRDLYVITDLESTNGTYVDRVRIREAYLHPDCHITLGKTEIRFAPVDEQVRIVPSDKARYGEIIGRNQKLREIYAILSKVAPTDATIIIEGETGTGKEVVARTIHQQSPRCNGPFMVFDCGAVPENLIESELFGHEKGAFTGAVMTRQGVFEMANGGTVFLDELGELALGLQPKLLRVLEQREVKRIGSNRPVKVDVRIIAATHRNLKEEVRAGRFREDLFYRLSVVRVNLPPLRKRKEDIPLLIKHFLKNGHFNRSATGGRKISQVSKDAMDRLLGYEWPGNVRELLNVVERAVSFADTDSIETHDLPDYVAQTRPTMPKHETDPELKLPSDYVPPRMEGGTFKDAKEKWVAGFERDYINHLLRKNGMNISHAAREAEIDRKYFRKLMRKYGISTDDSEGVDLLQEAK